MHALTPASSCTALSPFVAHPVRPWLRFFAADADTGTGDNDNADDRDDDANDDDADKGSKLDDLTPEQLRAEVSKLRRENAGKRTKANEATAAATAAQEAKDAAEAQRDAVLAALGIKPEGGAEVTVESLTEQLTGVTAERDSNRAATDDLKRENAVLRYAAGLGANGDRLLDSRSFLTKLSAVDPSDSKAVKAAITDALAEDTGFALVKVPGSSGSTDHTGGDTTSRSKSMREAAAKRIGGGQ